MTITTAGDRGRRSLLRIIPTALHTGEHAARHSRAATRATLSYRRFLRRMFEEALYSQKHFHSSDYAANCRPRAHSKLKSPTSRKATGYATVSRHRVPPAISSSAKLRPIIGRTPFGRHGLVKSTSPVHAGQESGIGQRPADVGFRTSVEASSTADFIPRVARREISIILLPVSIQVWRTSTKMRL
jgi:hypothetical protein